MNPIFPKGNLDSWNMSITKYLPDAMNTVLKTLDPVISAALLELTGSSADFDKEEASVAFEFDEARLPSAMLVELKYSTPSFKVEDVDEEAIIHDKAFLLAYLQQIESQVKTTKVVIDTKKGQVLVAARLEVGYKI